MTRPRGSWLKHFALAAAETDRLREHPDHIALLAAGMLGEAGSVIAELKKEQRDLEAYPGYLQRMVEEVGDFIWYFVRLVTELDDALLLDLVKLRPRASRKSKSVGLFLQFGAAVANLLDSLTAHDFQPFAGFRAEASSTWRILLAVAKRLDLDVNQAATANIAKIRSRWPKKRQYNPFFDDQHNIDEQLPRKLTVDFLDREHGKQRVVVLRCNNINFGDRLTDNIEDPDGYRYHDIFHFSYAVYLGWSPVVRALLRTKRKSVPKKDEGQDGARAVILEEAVSAIVFNRAKRLNFFDGIEKVDFDLLKLVREFVSGYEVEHIPMWQWEVAILEGYRMFRLLRNNNGGTITLDLKRRVLKFKAAPR